MALLYRFTKLNDRHNTGIFTFIVTRSVTRDLHRDATTKDFYYGYHRWAISFTRANDKSLGVYLILRNASPSTECFADYTLTLLNREHFSRNEQHTEKQCKFTADRTTQGIQKWILLSEIQSRKFGDETGEFLLELSLGNITTTFETHLQVSNGGPLKSGKFESASFGFGSFDWNVSIVVHNYGPGTTTAANNSGGQTNGNDVNSNSKDDSANGRIIYVFLNRLSGFDHPCRVKYRVLIGENKNGEDSGMLDQLSDAGGRIRGFQMQNSLTELLKSDGSVRVRVELQCCNAISEAKVPIVRNPSPTVNCYDLANSPHANYYIQDGIDMGAMMDTNLPVAKVKESPKVYLESDNKLTVHVEWCDSIMLFNHIYHKYDDISRTHCHQMRREIGALTNENLSLEKQLLSYQRSIGNNRSQSKDNGSETGSLRGHHLHQRPVPEVHLNENSSSHVPITHGHGALIQSSSSSSSHNLHHSVERRSTGSGGSGQMLNLPANVNANPQISPIHSPLVQTRNYAQNNFHQQQQQQQQQSQPLQQPPQKISRHRSDYHHQLPAIPVQTQGHRPLMHTVSGHASPQMKIRTHYGSLPLNTNYDYDEEELIENVIPRLHRTLHRSRERVLDNYGNIQQMVSAPLCQTSSFGLPNSTGNSQFSQSLSTLPYTGQAPYGPVSGGGNGVAIHSIPGNSGGVVSVPSVQQSHLMTNGWINNGMSGAKPISPGIVQQSYFE
ncbi:hypothetical protein BLOT_009222 [Blomia tropicalis]|nr:hypothetical protein BLOT_009222 [Blomia tropicalis]